MENNQLIKKAQPFVFGGLSGMIATVCIQPIDLIKVRIQLSGEGQLAVKTSPVTTFINVVRNESPITLYKGLSAALLRQATYTTARLGLFNTFIDKTKESNGPGKPVTFFQRLLAGSAAGGLAAIIGNPADLALIRMQSDGMLPAAKRANYSGVINTLARITREEGVLSLWNGATPTVVRAIALNVGMLTTYSEFKARLTDMYGDGAVARFGASGLAGFFASFLSLPFDFCKTRLQKQRPDADGKLPYKNLIDCARKVVATEGPTAFYKGFGIYYVRIAPHAMITLLVADYLNGLMKK